MLKNEKGFTLIEIVMVIILLGILAAVAIPRFIDLSAEAKKSATKGALGGVRGALAISFANNAIHGHSTYPAPAGYPVDAAGIGSILAEGNVPDNPYSTEPTKNNVDVLNDASIAKGVKGAAPNEWRYNRANGTFWSAQSYGVGANGF